MKTIYLDNGATTMPSPGVVAIMNEVLTEGYGNPSSLHEAGRKAEHYVTHAREQVANYLKCPASSVTFTSCGTESINTALAAFAMKNRAMGRHILTERGEHPATAEALKRLAEEGFEIEYLALDASGRIYLEDLEKKVRPDTAFVTCLHVNNETGVIQPIAQMGHLIKSKNPRTLFHVDCVQSFAKLPVLPVAWEIDALSASAHKFHGPKGVGCLYVKKNLVLRPLVVGGGQEKGMRSGTQNVPGIAGFGQAVAEYSPEHEAYVRGLKTDLAQRILAEIPDTKINGPSIEDGAGHVLNVQIPGVRSEVLLHALEDYGILISAGSACSSNKPEEKSPALSALGLSAADIECSCRFSFSYFNTKDELDEVVRALKEVVPQLRRYTRH